MAAIETLPDVPVEDSPPIGGAPWFTHRRTMLFVIGWLTLFAVIGAFVSNPFQSETSAGATPDYAKVMFLHGLLIGMVGLLALLTCQVMQLRSTHVRVWIAVGVVVATVLAAVGGIWDKTIPGSEVPMWTQIFGFFALDEILVTLLVGMFMLWRSGALIARTLPFIAAALAAFSMLAAALMGHLAGWIMEFGENTPPLIGNFRRFAGFDSVDSFTGALVGSHSHEMAVGVMALTIILLAQQFGYALLHGSARVIARIGVGMIAIGVVVMTLIYVASAVSQYAPPTAFANDPNGIAGDDIVTGILVMGGGVLVVLAFLRLRSVIGRPVRMAALWAWILSFATVVILGYAIEMNETYFGGGDPTAAGASKDAIFTWLHQDIGLFLLPALVMVMLAVERLVEARRRSVIGLTTIAGTTVAFIGALVYVFVDPTLHGPGYLVTTVGLLLVGAALLATLWYGTVGRVRRITLPETVKVAAIEEADIQLILIPKEQEPVGATK